MGIYIFSNKAFPTTKWQDLHNSYVHILFFLISQHNLPCGEIPPSTATSP